MALAIDSTDPNYIALAQTALDTLLGIPQALTYTQQQYRVGGRYVMRVTEGPQILTAQGFHTISTTLVRRVIASAHWTRIVFANSNDCSPDKWLKDTMWSGFKSLVPFVAADAGFMNKVVTTGSSSIARWSGAAMMTANLTTMGTIRMEVVPDYILLAHELVHADRIARAFLLSRRANSTFLVDQRQKPDPTTPGIPTHLVNQPGFTSARVVGANVVMPNGTQLTNAGNVITAMPGGRIWVDGTMELSEEIATVGLSDDDNVVPADGLAITENMVRQEHNIHKRLKYGAFNKTLN